MEKWFKDILPDKDPYHNRGRDQMRKKGVRNSSACDQYSTRNISNQVHVHSRTAYYNNSFLPSTVRLWNKLPANIKSNVSVKAMKIYLNKYILEFELRVVLSMVIFIRKISKLIPTVVVNW